MNDNTITIIGCGKVGKAFAYSLLTRGHTVFLQDISTDAVMGAFLDLRFCGDVKVGLTSNTNLIIFSAKISNFEKEKEEIYTQIQIASDDNEYIPVYVFSNPVKEITTFLQGNGVKVVIPNNADLDKARARLAMTSYDVDFYCKENIHASSANPKLNECRAHYLKLQQEMYQTPSVYNAVHFALKQMEKERVI